MESRSRNNVREILMPFTGELPLSPSVHIDDPVSRAIEVMVSHDRHVIVVLRNSRPIGQVRLRDAFAFVGIRVP